MKPASKAVITIVSILILCSATMLHSGDAYFNANPMLKRPGVRLVALTALGGTGGASDAAALRWKKLDREFRPLGLRIAAIALPTKGVCKSTPPFVVDEFICDHGAAVTTAMKIEKPGQSFLWNHEKEQMVRLGTVQDVETAIREYFKDMPRLVVADPNIKALPKQAKKFSRTRLYDLLAQRMGAGIKQALTLTDQNERRTLLQAVDGKPAAHPPACKVRTCPKTVWCM